MHSPIQLSDLSLEFNHKICFDSFSYTIYPGEKIAIIGDNGSGKSSLLQLIAQLVDPTSINAHTTTELGAKPNPDGFNESELVCGYVPQIIVSYPQLSGGQRFNKQLSLVLSKQPDLLLLDEPTNHLDAANRKSLIQLLRNYPATLVLVSHDLELLDNCIDSLWHIYDGKVHIFNGKYSDYLQYIEQQKAKLAQQINHLKQAKKQQHEELMHEQRRARTSREQGKKHISQHKWPTITSQTKARRAETTAGKNTAALNQTKAEINTQLAQLWQPEEINYSFNLVTTSSKKSFVAINHGRCGYRNSGDNLALNSPILANINFTLASNERIALVGNNGSGKSTLVKAIMQQAEIWRDGEWLTPAPQDIAYLDQHYANLPTKLSVIEYISTLSPSLNHAELRNFLNQFLFRKNEEVNQQISRLSGGERARLSLARIALQQPKLLILDEVSNNLDLTTKEHIRQVLISYPGALLIISHDIKFVSSLELTNSYDLISGQLLVP